MSTTRIPEALALLREKGWCKGRFEDHDGAHCIAGAVLEAYRLGPHQVDDQCTDDWRAIQDVIRAHHDFCSVARFNDDPATTFADVEAVLEKAFLERGAAL